MKAFFFDRDGTLNVDTVYINKPDNIILFQKVAETLKLIKSMEYYIFIITNQSGIGRRLITPEEYRSVNNKFLSLFDDRLVDEILYCPHIPEVMCQCRKPEILLVEVAREHYSINYRKSYFVGDKISDIQCGKKLGMKTILIADEYTDDDMLDLSSIERPDFVIKSISEIEDLLSYS